MRNQILLFLGITFAGLAIWYFSAIFLYIIIAGILSLIGQPIDRFYSKFRLGKFRLSQTLSAALAFLTLFSVFFLLAIFFMPLITEEAKILSDLDRNTAMASLQQPIQEIETILNNFHVEFESGNMESYIQEKLVSVLTITNLSLFFNQVIGVLGDFFVAFFAISFLTFFFLRDEKLIADSLLSVIPENYAKKVKNILDKSEQMLKRYFIGVLVEILLVITFLTIGLSIAGIEHALLIALFAGIVNVIPYVGPLIGTGFALFVGLTTNPDMDMMGIVIKIFIVFPIVNLADAFLLQPLIYSSSVKAHPLEIFLVILAGATLGGIGGMLLAVPSYTVLRVVVKEFHTHFRER
ncbi:MAG: AI-2E family transporter [Bacteroidetes bacterium]|nr:MAG: AI-2E family transporter [Bacteroidota bacterium]